PPEAHTCMTPGSRLWYHHGPHGSDSAERMQAQPVQACRVFHISAWHWQEGCQNQTVLGQRTMNYVRCINNKAYVHVPGEASNGVLADLTIGAIYKVLPTAQNERDTGVIRIVDNSGEDYLYPVSYFQPLDENTVPTEWESGHATLTIHLDPRTKAILHAEAL